MGVIREKQTSLGTVYERYLEMVPTYQFICTGFIRFHGNVFFFSRLDFGVNA
ncbi:hypothetical protein BC30052_2123 [Bacillus cereus]|nr:hypothetical protein BC30052_2123 [Bacillus cereus]